jgi:hypothetical protein
MSNGGRTPRRVARLLVLTASNRLIHGADGPDGWKNTGEGGTTFGGDEFATPIEGVARNLDDIGGDMPEDVARWLVVRHWDPKGLTDGWFNGPGSPAGMMDQETRDRSLEREALASKLDDIGAQRMTQGRTRYDLLVELCAGTAALSWASAGMRFPVSRMGSKAGYAHAILSSVGLREGDPLPRYLWNEPDPELARTLALLASPGGAQAVAEVIRSWIPCPNGHEADGGAWCLDCATWTNGEPPEDVEHVEQKADGTIRRWASGPSTGKQDARRLWERLRKERPEASPEREGAWLFASARTANGSGAGFFKAEEFDSSEWAPTSNPGGASNPRPTMARNLDTLAPLPATVICGRAEDVPTPPDCSRVLCYIDPPYSDVAPVIPPVLAAERLPLGRVGRSEADAALSAHDLDRLREPVGHFRVAVLEVLRATGVEAQVLDSVVERVVIDVVDDLIWTEWATDGLLHYKAVFRDAPPVVADVPVPTLKPALALVHATGGGQLLPLRGHLRDLAIGCKAFAGSSAQLAQALAWADGALAGRGGVPCAAQGGGTDLAGDIERHCTLRVRARQEINTAIHDPGRKTTGYAHGFDRAAVVAVARRWAEAGAHVVISEAEPIPELVADGWAFADIADARIGQRRTFSRQQREVLTSNRPLVPRHAWPSRGSDPRQGGLFAQG